MMTLRTQDIHHTSSFPSILDSYLYSEGLEKAASVAKAVTQMKNLKERKVQRPRSAAELQEKKALLQQRHLESYRQLHHLKDSLSRRYAELLTEKVQKQRQDMKQQKSAHLKKHSTQSSRRLTLQELVGSAIKDNAAFLKSLPKTRYYMILEFQRQLGQSECLQDVREQEVFRSRVDWSKTVQLEKQLKQTELSSKSATELKLEDLLKKKLEVFPKMQISHEEKDNRQEHHDAFSQSGRGESISTPVLQGKQIQKQDESELRFPSRANESLHTSDTAAVTQRKLRLMHSLALYNMAQSRSLILKNGLMPQFEKGYTIQDMMEHVYPKTERTKELRFCSDPPHSPKLLRDQTTPESSGCIKEEINAQAEMSSFECFEELQNISSSDKAPLSMEDVSSCSILLVKTFDKKMWSNYA